MGEFFSPIDNQSKYAYNKFMSNKAGKIWGSTELILANSSLEFHRINFKKGGVCSKHKHEWKWNGFYVMEGEMKINAIPLPEMPTKLAEFFEEGES